MPSDPLGLNRDAQVFLRRRLAGLGGAQAVSLSENDGVQGGLTPLSPDQRRLWFLDGLKPHRADYNVAAAWRVSGPLNPSVLDAALIDIVKRHDALRTVIVVSAGEPQAQLASTPSSLLDKHDLSSEDDPIESARLLAAEKSRLVLDLETGPLYRFWLAELGRDDRVFGFTVHHLVFDRDSLVILLQDLVETYEHIDGGRSVPTPVAPVATYANYARALHEMETHADRQPLRDYWREQLEGVSAFLDLPTDQRRPTSGPSGTAGECRVELDSFGAKAIQRLARHGGTSPFVVCLAAFNALLYRYTNAPSFSVGCPFTARNRVEFEQLIGFFTRSLPIAIWRNLTGDPSFRRLVGEAREAMLGAHEHQAVALEDILSLLRSPRDVAYNPLFQVWFDYAVSDAEDVRWPTGLTAAPFPCADSRTRFDLELHLTEKQGKVEMRLLYSADLFERETAEEFIGCYRRLLEAAVAAPDTALSRLPLLGGGDIESIVNGWSLARETD